MKKVITLVGPTAVGKSDLAIELALKIDGEVINADAMQLYQDLDIATAKVPLSDRKGVVHHLLDIYPVSKEASVAEFQSLAREKIKEVLAKDKYPILVGGSGLYVTAVLDDLTFQITDKAIRDKYQTRADKGEDLYAELKNKDPMAAENILPGNVRRIVRALEVIELTGKPFSATLPKAKNVFEDVRIGLEMDREILDKRIELRVEKMFEMGIVEEVKALGSQLGVTASKALGVSQVLDFLAGRIDLATAKEETVTATRKFSRRQMSWFRRDSKITWLNAQDEDLLEQAHRLGSK
ncbi:MAG: tRNA (adenosine(37)-N6)-dimethylallyltransferase MiaA [Candidatus Nanopelagicales bacterium]